jgi:hypothetical protein
MCNELKLISSLSGMGMGGYMNFPSGPMPMYGGVPPGMYQQNLPNMYQNQPMSSMMSSMGSMGGPQSMDYPIGSGLMNSMQNFHAQPLQHPQMPPQNGQHPQQMQQHMNSMMMSPQMGPPTNGPQQQQPQMPPNNFQIPAASQIPPQSMMPQSSNFQSMPNNGVPQNNNMAPNSMNALPNPNQYVQQQQNLQPPNHQQQMNTHISPIHQQQQQQPPPQMGGTTFLPQGMLSNFPSMPSATNMNSLMQTNSNQNIPIYQQQR